MYRHTAVCNHPFALKRKAKALIHSPTERDAPPNGGVGESLSSRYSIKNILFFHYFRCKYFFICLNAHYKNTAFKSR